MKTVRNFEYSLFELGEAFEYGVGIVPLVNTMIEGRCAGSGWDMGILAQCVYNCAGKDYLEIGSYFGGSLIVAGLAMRFRGLDKEGTLVSVDPYSPDYPWRMDAVTGLESTSERMKRNVEKFGFGVEHYPYPAQETSWSAIDEKYDLGVVYVDGSHDVEDFDHDLTIAEGLSPVYIVVDNVDKKYPHIVDGVIRYFLDTPYQLVHMSGITAVLERMEDVS